MGAAGSVNKVFWSELDIALHETALDLLGAEGEVESTWLDGYTFSLSGPIYAGTNEIQRNIVAERILGLPREPKGAQPSEVRPRRRPARLRGVPRLAARRRPTPSRSPAPGPTATARPGSSSGPGWPSRASCRSPPTPRPSSSCIAFEALGRHAVPGPVGRVRGVPPDRARPRGRGRRHASRCRRTCPTRSTPTSPTRSTSATRLTTDVGELVGSVDRTRRLFRVEPATGARLDRPRRSTWPCSRRPPSCSARASGSWPTR